MTISRFIAEADQLRQRAIESLFGEFADLCDGVLVVDRDARVVWMNETYPKRLGIGDVAAVLGRPVEEIIPNSLMREVVTTGKPIMLDIMDFGGESFVVMRLPLRDDQGQVIGAVGMVLFDDPRRLAPLVSRYQKLRADLAEAQKRLADARRTKYTLAGFVGAAPACRLLKEDARRVARTASPVLLLGETGTGKELLAQAIHAAGPRAAAPFVAVNIAAIPDTLLEAELFGVAPGAYTGAEKQGRDGKFILANGGTLFFDEVGDMSLSLQAKLLRALQEREIEPVGSNRLIPLDVRVIAATNRDLLHEVRLGRFRADLYYRLNVVCLRIPPLRERLADLPLLCEALIDQLARQLALPPRNITAGALARLRRHDWPGNVRELANVLERALQMSDADSLDVADLEPILPPPAMASAHDPAGDGSRPRTLDETMAEAGREAIRAALLACRGNKAQAARRLGISRATLYEKIAALGLDPRD